MKKIVVFNISAHGHLNPSLPIVKELVDRGNEVIYYGTPEFKSKIEYTGAIYKEYKNFPSSGNADTNNFVKNYALLYFRIVEVTFLILDDLIEEVKKMNPDYIIYDSFCLWGKCVSEILGIKSVALNSVYLISLDKVPFNLIFKEIASFNISKLVLFIKGNISYNKIVKKYDIKKAKIIKRLFSNGDTNIVFTSKYFQANYEKFEKLKYNFVGPSIFDRGENIDKINYDNLKGKVVYISLGTISNNNLEFYKDCIDSLQSYKGTIIISVGKKIPIDSLGEVPSNIIIKNHVNQIELLKHVDLFITHGGMNSVQEGLSNGIPLLIFPQHLEQNLIGNQVEHLGAGIVINKFSKKNLLKEFNKIIENYDYYKNNSVKISNSLIESGGYKKAADIILG